MVWMEIIARFIVPFSILIALFATPASGEERIKGTRSTLHITSTKTPSVPKLDQSIGRTKITLRSEPQGDVLLTEELEGNWFCFGFNTTSRAYIIGGIRQVGAWLPLASILYVNEDDRSVKRSSFVRRDHIALSATASPSVRYIVFIDPEGLSVLDTKRDTIKKLGKAPLPPPSEFAADSCEGQDFEWGGCGNDGYVELDAGILRFLSDNELEVSYGKDGPKTRAKKRWVKRYKL